MNSYYTRSECGTLLDLNRDTNLENHDKKVRNKKVLYISLYNNI